VGALPWACLLTTTPHTFTAGIMLAMTLPHICRIIRNLQVHQQPV
jgi:hypothetical protein